MVGGGYSAFGRIFFGRGSHIIEIRGPNFGRFFGGSHSGHDDLAQHLRKAQVTVVSGILTEMFFQIRAENFGPFEVEVFLQRESPLLR